MTTPNRRASGKGTIMTKQIKIDWNKDTAENGRYWITDACTSSYVSEDQIAKPNGNIESMQSVARAYASTYDHGDNESGYAVCNIEDMVDGESHDFAFDGRGNFEWDTTRQG